MKKLRKVTHKINLGPARQNFPKMLSVDLKNNLELRRKVELSGVKGKSCAKGFVAMITKDTLREIYEEPFEDEMGCDFVYKNFKKKRFHPYLIRNDAMNDLAAANPEKFLDFFLGTVLELSGFKDRQPDWLKRKVG